MHAHGLFVNSSSITTQGPVSPHYGGHLALLGLSGGWGDIWKTLESELVQTSPWIYCESRTLMRAAGLLSRGPDNDVWVFSGMESNELKS